MRDMMRMAQVLVAVLATLLSAVPEMRGLQGLRVGEIELFEPAERPQTQEAGALAARATEDAEEFFGNDAPDARIRGVRLALLDGADLRGCADSWFAPKRPGCAHPPTGPPTV
ncbi:MAG: hypothetical protein ACK4MV_01415 [Beijerinckiaceae bacterium]